MSYKATDYRYQRRERLGVYIRQLHLKRIWLHDNKKELEALEAGAPLASSLGSAGMFVRGGNMSDPTMNEAARRIRRIEVLRESVHELYTELTEFKEALSSCLNEDTAAMCWAKWVCQWDTRRIMGQFSIKDPMHVNMTLYEAENVLDMEWDR